MMVSSQARKSAIGRSTTSCSGGAIAGIAMLVMMTTIEGTITTAVIGGATDPD